MTIRIKLLSPPDAHLLTHVAPGAFDDPIDPCSAEEFLDDPRHHLAVAVDDDVIVGFVSAVHYVHPDKPRPELWINEVQVAPTHHRRGLAKAMLAEILQKGHDIGCEEAWVLTETGNAPAMRLYASLGGIEQPRDGIMFTFSLKDGQ